MKENNKYFHNYTFEDFLQDDYFISSVCNPTEETVAFWKEYLQTNPSNVNEYLQAKSYIKSIPFNKSQLSEEEVSNLWNSIENANDRSDSSSKRRKRIIYTTISIAAACLIGIMFIPSFFSPANQKEIDIYAFIDKTEAPDYQSSSAQLILSENKTVLLDDKESVIVYDSVCIKVKGNEEALSQKETASYNQLIVPRGKRSTLTLADGTKIWVNSGTRVIYPVEFNKKERELYVDGEIYIQVAHNKEWPFVVKTKDIGINVLGTEFNVTAYESEDIKRVILASGSIRITNKNEEKEILLSPNKMYQYNGDKGIVESVDISRYISWKDGMYIFENEKLAVIFCRLSRYYGEPIESDTEAGNMRCSGKLDLKSDLNDVLTGLTYTAPVIYEKRDNKFLIKHKP
ncbi:MAG: FecR domain-containing protein [Prevotella sp.]|jgi:hypothetical protein|nr:FecR domain-containing protein [Prevotella sp.]